MSSTSSAINAHSAEGGLNRGAAVLAAEAVAQEDVEPREGGILPMRFCAKTQPHAAVVDEAERIGEHRFGLGGKTGDEIGAEQRIGPHAQYVLAELHCVRPGMPTLHALDGVRPRALAIAAGPSGRVACDDAADNRRRLLPSPPG